MSTTDPDATPMRLKGGGTHPGYHTHYVVDGGKNRIILSVLVVPGEVNDDQPILDLIWRILFRWHIRSSQATGDMMYGTTERDYQSFGGRSYPRLYSRRRERATPWLLRSSAIHL